jgi:hypothetical protein
MKKWIGIVVFVLGFCAMQVSAATTATFRITVTVVNAGVSISRIGSGM